MLAFLTTIYGCGQTSTAPDQAEKKQGGVEQAENSSPSDAQKGEEPEKEANTPMAKSCADFYGPQDAQAYFETRATAADKQNLNPDGDEWACNEAGVTFKPEPEITLATFAELSDRESYGLLQCQFMKYVEDHGRDAANKYVNNKFEEEVDIEEAFRKGQTTNLNTDITSIQEHFIKDGYSCTWHEINDTLMRLRQSATASASSGTSASASAP
jgi:hypothetical protein